MLAADRGSTHVGYMRAVTKIFRVPTGIVGFAGDGALALELLDWFKKGMVATDYPKSLAESGTSAMYVDMNNRCWSYGKNPFPELCEDSFDAMGSGRDYALAAMYLGKSASEAVEVAIALDSSCGKGIDVLRIIHE
jgi:ATP-dependent protease HslVU (ClpYQ) peptidase subunit